MKKTYLSFLVIFLLLQFIPSASQAQVLINEYSASNLSQFIDDHSDYEDFVELYNASGAPVSLAGYHLSDDSANYMKYTFPAGASIPSNGFFRVWCSGRNTNTAVTYHTNFRLTQTKNTKEKLIFSDPAGVILDSLTLAKTQLGHSRGRTTNGAATWSIFTTPTPNNSNNASTPYLRYADKPDFSVGAGFYQPPIILIVSTTEPGGTIRYTTNGTLPTTASTIYSNGVMLTSTSVLKAITWSPDPAVLPSFVEFQTYFLNVNHTLPVISISGTQLNTLANGSGSLEPTGTFEYFDTAGVRKANTYGQFNRHGQDSWVLSQRSLDFISRDEMGYNHSIEEKLFEYSTRENFQRVILRAAGDDNYPADHRTANLGSAHVRDAYIHMLAKKGGMNLDVRNAEKSIVYLNGLYWGVYDIRENPDEHDYTEYYYGQDKYNLQYILTWGNTWAEYGGPTALSNWSTLYNYIMTHSMANAGFYTTVINQYDATSLADYVIANAMTVCSDWLNYNTGWWRGMDSTGTHLRWGYILWDNDATFGHYINYTGIPNTTAYADPCDPEGLTGNSDPEGHIQILNRLRQNPEFNQYYISRMIDLWNTVFSCDNMISQLDSIVNKLSPEMTAHAARWNGTYTEWQSNIDTLRTFILNRCNNLSSGFINCYGLTGPYEVTLTADPIGAGAVKFNSLIHDSLPWSGTYFGGMNNILEALPDTPYQFSNWSSYNFQTFQPNANAPVASVNLNSSDTITAHFTFATPVYEVGGTPVANVYPTLVTDYTVLDFSLPEALPVSIQLFDMNGKLITTLADRSYMQAGFHSMNLSLPGGSLIEGVYLLRFTAGQTQKSFKLVYTGR
ncbi:MAG: CotH kinase family protein [Bacteroidia bacterium]|nr:CotH kinase family protein [Bacteroidia bacterium]